MSTAAQSRAKAASEFDDAELDERYGLILNLIDQRAKDRKFTKEVTITVETRDTIEAWLRRKEYRVYDGSAPGTAGIDLGFYATGGADENILISWQGYEIAADVSSAAVGDTITWTITTQGVANGDVIYYVADGTVVSGDFTDNDLSAGVTVNENQAVITKTLDAAAVSGHTIDMRIYYDGLFAEEVAVADTVVIA